MGHALRNAPTCSRYRPNAHGPGYLYGVLFRFTASALSFFKVDKPFRKGAHLQRYRLRRSSHLGSRQIFG